MTEFEDNLPTYDEIIDRIRVDIKRVLPDLDPTIFESLVSAIAESNGGRHFDNVISLKQLVKELFPDTAIRENLERWSVYDGIIPLLASQASGYVLFTGVSGTTIPVGRVFQTGDGNTYISQVAKTITSNAISVSSLTRSGTTVTAKTSSAHNLASNATVLMSGAVETDYNGSVVITVTDTDEFTYEISATPTTPATGTIIATCVCAKVAVNSEETGIDKNLDSGATLTFVTTLSGADDDGYVLFSGITGGTDIETKENLLARTKYKRANPVANFNAGAIGSAALAVSGVTRVKVKRITPDIGQVTILFVKDNKANIIPTAAEVALVKAAIIAILPATSEESDVIVTAPTPITTNYSFTAISPDTLTMRNAIEAQLAAMYEDEATFETDITEDRYKAAIINTIDTETGERLDSFTLSSPAGDITVGTDSIGILGTISF